MHKLITKRLARRAREVIRCRAGLGIMLTTLLLLGIGVTHYKLTITRDIRFIGHSDRAAYVLMAQSLVQGNGFNVRYISFFFFTYPRDIVHREDHWPPFMAVMIAPFFLMFGFEPWAARVAPILIGSIGLPIATAALGYALSRRSYVGLAAGLMMLSNLTLFDESLSTLSDIAVAMVVAGFCGALLSARRHPRMHVIAGLFAAMAFYAKGSMLWLIPLYPVLAGLACGWRSLRRRSTYIGVAVAILGVAPWLISNVRQYGSPLHSTQSNVSGYFGLVDWSTATYAPYWGRVLPQTSDRWTKHKDVYGDFVLHNREQFTRYAVLGPQADEAAWSDLGPVGVWLHRRLNPAKPLPGPSFQHGLDLVSVTCSVAAAALCVVTLLGAALRFGRRLVERPRGESLKTPDHWQCGPTLALLLVMAIHWSFIVFLWNGLPRFAFLFLPIIAVMGCTGIVRMIEWPFLRHWARLDPNCWIITATLAMPVLAYAATNADSLKAYHCANSTLDRFPYRDHLFYPGVGDFLRTRLPRATVMANNPWDFMFYASTETRSVKTPQARPADIFSIARYYKVTHYLADEDRPGMWWYASGRHPGMKRVADAPGRLFELDYRFLPDSGIATRDRTQGAK